MRRHPVDSLILVCLLAGGCTSRADDLEPQADTGSTGSTSTAEADSTTEPSAETTDDSTTSEDGTTDAVEPGSSTSGGGSSSGDDGSESTTTATVGFSVSGQITRSVDPADGNDGIGTLYFAVVDNCGVSFDLIAADTLPNADTSEPVPYTVTEVPEGNWYMVVYLDDDEDAMLPEPSPDSGDLVVSSGAGIGCAELTVDGEDVDGIDLDLNFVLP